MDDDVVETKRRALAQRLKEERQRVGLSAEETADLGRVGRTTQFAYEKAANAPDTDYLLRLQGGGFDVVYVLSGHRDRVRISACSRALLDRYEVVPKSMRDVIDNVALLASMAFAGREHYATEVTYSTSEPAAPPSTLHEPAPGKAKPKRPA